MLVNPGDLIPVLPSATGLPWTRRKSQILHYLHRGPVTFSTLVYDTNVGDISAIATYFNPERVSIHDLNSRFGHYPVSGNPSGDVVQDSGVTQNALSVRPRLLLYPEKNLNNQQVPVHRPDLNLDHKQVTVQRTLKWVLSQDGKESSGSSPSPIPSPTPIPLLPPLDNVWGVVGEGRSRGVSRGSSGGDSEEPLLPRWDIGEEPIVPKLDKGEGAKEDNIWDTWGSDHLFESLLKITPDL